MNTRGHSEVAEQAGLPLLKSFLGGGALRSIEAMRMGNWLTDVSQTVDPVAYASAGGAGKAIVNDLLLDFHKSIDALLEQMSSAVLRTLPSNTNGPVQFAFERIEDLVGSKLDQLKTKVHAAVDGLFGAADADERTSDLAQFFRSIFLVIGYFKYVHPAAPDGMPRMNYSAFLAIFGALGAAPGSQKERAAPDRPGAFTQYYPHEHLDRAERLRPPRRAGERPIFEPGPQLDGLELHGPAGAWLGPRSPRSEHAQPKPDIYSYLRDDMVMAGGLLAEVDQELHTLIDSESWESLWQSMQSGQPARDVGPELTAALETSVPWHKALAKLGHALHQVEDFFAHSNWIELAAQARGDSYLSKVLPPKLPKGSGGLQTEREILERTRTVFAKRLKRHLTEPKSDWNTHPPESWVVTGSFDLKDTLISLAHLTEELWGGDVPDPWQNTNELAEDAAQAIASPSSGLEQVRKYIRDIGDLLSDTERALADDNNPVAKAWKEKIGKNLERVRTPAVQHEMIDELAHQSPLISGAPAEVKSAFINAMVLVTKVRGAVSLYQSIKTVTDFFSSPFAWIRDQLHLTLKDAFVFWSRELLYEYIGMNRIGCHSLMAKDHGGEPLYTPNKECATAVHYAIVHTLLMPWDTGDRPAIDWLAFLEFFLQNPVSAKQGRLADQTYELSVSIIHTVSDGEQLDSPNARYSLTKRYARTAVGTFNWRTIADANFRTGGLSTADAQRVINLTLAESKTGVPVTPPNYAFKSGVKVVIPNQRLRLKRRIFVPDSSENWFAEVMDKGWKVFRGEDSAGTSMTPLNPYKPVRIRRDDTELQIKSASAMRLTARHNYRPPAAP